MNPILRNILAVIAGIILGGILNMLVISISGNFISLPEGVDPNNLESINANIHLYEIKHFIFPIIAHALGSLLAGFVAAILATSHHLKLALVAGGFFIIGGIFMALLLEAPIWIETVDIIFAYFPMGFIGGKLANLFRK